MRCVCVCARASGTCVYACVCEGFWRPCPENDQAPSPLPCCATTPFPPPRRAAAAGAQRAGTWTRRGPSAWAWRGARWGTSARRSSTGWATTTPSTPSASTRRRWPRRQPPHGPLRLGPRRRRRRALRPAGAAGAAGVHQTLKI